MEKEVFPCHHRQWNPDTVIVQAETFSWDSMSYPDENTDDSNNNDKEMKKYQNLSENTSAT